MNYLPKRILIFFWFATGYVRRHFFFVLAGVLLGILGFFEAGPLLALIPELKKPLKIGIVGKYGLNEMPLEVQRLVSRGLTKVGPDGTWKADLSESWQISEDGKEYTFVLKDNIFWHDKKKFVCQDVNYNFSDVELFCKNDKTIVFRLKDPYAGFPVALSRPIFKQGFVGMSEFKVKEIKTNGPFIESLELEEFKGGFGKKKIWYKFYPTEEQLLVAFRLGKINMIENLISPFELKDEKSVKISSLVRKDKYVGLFFNTAKGFLSDKNLRQALCYSIKKDTHDRTISPISPLSWAFNENVKPYDYDLNRAKELFGKIEADEKMSFVISTFPEYLGLAEDIKKNWEEGLGKIKVGVKSISSFDQDYDVLLIEKAVPSDPDQYIYWHSTQEETNITKFKDPRIDKLLEDGRKTLDFEARKKIYFDFQRYLLEDVPVCFLFHPTYYKIERR